MNQKDSTGRGAAWQSLMGQAIVMRQGPSVPSSPRWGHWAAHPGLSTHKACARSLSQGPSPARTLNTLEVPGAGVAPMDRDTETKWVLGPAWHPHPTPPLNPTHPFYSLAMTLASGHAPGLGGPVSLSRMLGQEQEPPAWPVPFSATGTSVIR